MKTKFKDKIEGDHIILRKTELADAEDIFRWRTGHGGRFLRQPENYSLVMQQEWIKSRPDTEINYMILDKQTMEKLGTIGIYQVNEADGVANVGRLIIKDEYLTKSHPFGLEALLLTYDYLFNQMNFRKMTGDILTANAAMYKLQTFLGMKEEGRLKKHVLIGNAYEDLHIMSIFKDQFESTYKKKIIFLLKSFMKEPMQD